MSNPRIGRGVMEFLTWHLARSDSWQLQGPNSNYFYPMLSDELIKSLPAADRKRIMERRKSLPQPARFKLLPQAREVLASHPDVDVELSEEMIKIKSLSASARRRFAEQLKKLLEELETPPLAVKTRRRTK